MSLLTDLIEILITITPPRPPHKHTPPPHTHIVTRTHTRARALHTRHIRGKTAAHHRRNLYN